MELTLNSGKIIRATAQRGNKPTNWSPSGDHYKITMRIGRKSHSFDFWDSVHAMQNETPVDIRGALSCFASAVVVFKYDEIDDVCDGMKAKDVIRVYKACEKSAKHADRLGLSEEDLQELQDY